jgi:folate-dependent phosphoribosylglycinamide formyltransferase PurN
MRPWVTFFSQTGSEILNLSQKLERYPDVIITNKQTLVSVNQELLASLPVTTKLVQTTYFPNIDEYYEHITENAFVTLHGWLRIIPAAVCEKYEIYNLHPANLKLHPHLKGKDPQKRAVAELLPVTGNTIHRCTSVLDAGEIASTSTVNIESLFEFEAIHKIHEDATNLWYSFLKDKLI